MFKKMSAVLAVMFVLIALMPFNANAGGGQRAWQGNSQVPSDMYFEASVGNLPGITPYMAFGRNGDIDIAAGEDLWDKGGIYTGHPTGAAETMEIVSSSANDVLTTGTGAWTVLISNLLDANGETADDVIVSLNGATPVSLGAITYYRGGTINVLTAGATASNEGVLTLRHSTTTANIFTTVPVGQNTSSSLTYTVPVGKTLFLNAGNIRLNNIVNGATTAAALISVRMRPFGGVYNTLVNPEISQSSPYIINGSNYIPFTARTDIKIQIQAVSLDNTVITGNLSGLLVND